MSPDTPVLVPAAILVLAAGYVFGRKPDVDIFIRCGNSRTRALAHQVRNEREGGAPVASA